MLVKPSSWAKMSAWRIAWASASSSTITSSKVFLQAARHEPLWSRITIPAPIYREDAKSVASMLISTDATGGGDHFGVDEEVSHLWETSGL
jgi:hypothetical protein